MRVLFLSHYDETHAGGIELVVSHLARELAGLGVEVAWAATRGSAPRGDAGASIQRIPMHSFNVIERATGLPYPIWSPWSLPKLVREVGRADVVHIHDAIYFGSQFAGWFARRRGTPIVATQHVGFIPYPSRALRLLQRVAHRVLTRPFLRRASAIAFVSDRVRREFAGELGGVEDRTIYNGVDLGLFHPSALPQQELRARLGLDPARPVFLFVGRFNRKKGLSHIRRAAQELPRVQWVFVGWGNEDPAAWALPNVTVAGRKPPEALAEWYGAADLLVLPSVGEGFPLVVQEAMACGTPCLVSEETREGCAPARALLISAGPEAAGFLEACRDLAAAPEALARDRARVAEFAAGAWSWKACASEYLRLYERLLPSRPGAPAPAGPDAGPPGGSTPFARGRVTDAPRPGR